MYLQNIEIKGFRGIKNLKIDKFSDINLFVGKNNSGKTSILEAIFLMIGMSNPELALKIDLFRDLQIQDIGDLRSLFFNLDFESTLQLKCGYKLKNQNCQRELEIKPAFNNFNDKKSKANNSIMINEGSSLSNKEYNELTFNFKNKEGLNAQVSNKSYIKFENILANVEPNSKYREKLKGVFIPSNQIKMLNLDFELSNIIENKNTQEIIDILKIIDPRITDIKFGFNQNILVDLGFSRLMPLYLLGDGIKRFLTIILGIRNAKNGVLLIDEVENGLHFSTMKLLWETILIATSKFNVQLFITTHNLETLKYLKEAVEKTEINFKSNRIANFSIAKVNDETKAYFYEFEQFEFAVENGIEVR